MSVLDRIVKVSLLLLGACGSSGGAADATHVGCERDPDSSGCICGPFSTANLVPVCAPSSVGASAYCCSVPSTQECECALPICQVSPTIQGACTCSYGVYSKISANQRDVCLPPSGGTCCRFDGPHESNCACHNGPCLADETTVATCRPSDVSGCGDNRLSVATCAQ